MFRETTLRVTRQDANTNLVVLDWEKYEAVRIFLEQRLVRFLRLDGRCHGWLLGHELGSLVNLSSGFLEVLLAGSIEAQLLYWAVRHLKSLDARCGLSQRPVRTGRQRPS